MKKRISYADWIAIGPGNYAVKCVRPMCKYTLIKEGNKFKRATHSSLVLSFDFYSCPLSPGFVVYVGWRSARI